MCGVSGGTDRRRRVRGSRDQGQQTQRHSVCVGGRHCAALPRSTDSRHTADTHTAKRIPPPTTTAAPLTAGWAALTLSSTDDMRGSESRGIKCFYPWVFAGKKVFDPLLFIAAVCGWFLSLRLRGVFGIFCQKKLQALIGILVSCVWDTCAAGCCLHGNGAYVIGGAARLEL